MRKFRTVEASTPCNECGELIEPGWQAEFDTGSALQIDAHWHRDCHMRFVMRHLRIAQENAG
jgi:hypothetical protein